MLKRFFNRILELCFHRAIVSHLASTEDNLRYNFANAFSVSKFVAFFNFLISKKVIAAQKKKNHKLIYAFRLITYSQKKRKF